MLNAANALQRYIKRGAFVQYVFTAVFTRDEDGSLLVSFPDLPECCALGTDMVDAVKKAEENLTLCLFDMEQRNIPIPEGRYPEDIEVGPGEVTSVVLVNTDTCHERYANKTSSYNIVVPLWLCEMAEKRGANVTCVVQNSLRAEFGMPTYESYEELPPPKAEVKVEAKAEVKADAQKYAKPDKKQIKKPDTKANEAAASQPKPIKTLRTAQEQAAAKQEEQGEEEVSFAKKKVDPVFGYTVLGLMILLIVAISAYVLIFVMEIVPIPGMEARSNVQTSAPISGHAQFDNHANVATSNPVPGPMPEGNQTSVLNAPSGLSVVQLREYYDNQDIVARLAIPGTTINHAVVRGLTLQQYQNHDIHGNASPDGWIHFSPSALMNNPQDNMTLFGRNMPNGEFFHDLSHFVNEEFFAQNRFVHLETDYGTYAFEIFSFYVDQNSSDLPTAFLNHWGGWIAQWAGLCMHGTGPEPTEPYPRVITLVTETAIGSNARFILHAMLVS